MFTQDHFKVVNSGFESEKKMTMYVRTVVPMTITISSQDYENDVVIDSRTPYKILPLWAAQRLEFQELWEEEKVEVATDSAFTNIITSIPTSELDNISLVRGLPNGVASLDTLGKVPASQIPNTLGATTFEAAGQKPLLIKVGGSNSFTFNEFGEFVSLAGYGIFYDGNVSNTAFASTGSLFITSGKGVGDTHDITIKPSGTGKIKLLAGSVEVNGAALRSGTGSPEGAVVASVGSLYLRTDGGAGTTLYVKESGTGNTGWSAK